MTKLAKQSEETIKDLTLNLSSTSQELLFLRDSLEKAQVEVKRHSDETKSMFI